jgi:N-acetylneuraminic acid mutarotase
MQRKFVIAALVALGCLLLFVLGHQNAPARAQVPNPQSIPFSNPIPPTLPPGVPADISDRPLQPGAPAPPALADAPPASTPAGLAGAPAQGTPTATPPCSLPVATTWTPVAALPSARNRMGLAFFAPNGKFYAPGGEDTTGNSLAAIAEYDPTTNTWTNRANLPVAVENTGAVTVGNYVYVPGGVTVPSNVFRNTMQRYDPVADAVTTVAPMPAVNAAHATVALGTRVYVLGGSTTAAEGTTNFIYDTTTNTWSSGAPVPTAVQFAAGATDGTYIYLIGGRLSASSQDLNIVQRYDPGTNTWQAVAPLSVLRGGLAAFFDGRFVWAVNGGWNTYLTSTEYYNPTTNSWTPGPATNTGVRTVAAAFGNGMALKAGGYNGNYSAVAEKLPFTTPPCPSATSVPVTPIGTPPSPTRTRTVGPTATATATATPNACQNYAITQSSGASLVAGTQDIGNHCDDCTTVITLPFSYTLYDQSFITATVGSNGNLGFVDAVELGNQCLPNMFNNFAILPYWDDLNTNANPGCPATGCGIYTDVSGSAPNRIFTIEWRAVYHSNLSSYVNFEVRLFEGQTSFEVIYGTVPDGGISATVGVQRDTGSRFTQFQCNTGGISAGLKLTFTQPQCATPTVTPTPTACAISFTDVHPTDYFYEPVRYLYCHGVISGYGDNTFRPYNNTTRAQMVKIVVLGFGIAIQTPADGTHTFTDVLPDNPFFSVIETAAAHNIVSGYNTSPPCAAGQIPCFQPNANVTRGQLSKIDVVAATWPLLSPPTGTFTDVPPGSPFYTYVETAVCHGVISGYADHTFHPGANATRGQISKIVYLSITPSTPGTCQPTATAVP